ncbi:phenylacetate--CoA ligase family protein [Ferrovibrio sp.]|uniref:phenylacetate--CoA ligase family protein n=1 Tax=Ferrovibrio sp. TaxID=1917215 RepID=UPI0035B0C870
MRVDRFQHIRELYAEACLLAPALRARFVAADLVPEEIRSAADLNRLPVLKKETLLAQQQAEPPFGGYLACHPGEMSHIYVSPGPIFEPSLAADTTGHGMDMMFAAAGLGPGDLALNTWSYHLVPAGLLFEQGLRAVGAAVVPSGTGNTDLQADLLLKLPITAFLGSTAFFQTVIERLETQGHALPAGWQLRHAFLGGEFGDWSAKRRRLELTYNIKTWSLYGTADFGLIGYERADVEGYLIHPERYVQICDPVTGVPLPEGVAGEIVVTTLTRGWPMIRFGTGDVSTALETDADGGVSRIAPLQGRIGQAVKAREIFIYPNHVETLPRRVDGLLRATVTIRRSGNRDEVAARGVLSADADESHVGTQLRQVFAGLTRLQLDHVEFVSAAALPEDSPLLSDARQLSP